MTDKRKGELLNACIGWICEVASNNEDLYSSLHNVIGLSDSEIEEVGIDYLNEYFTDKPDKCLLFSKVTLTADNGSTDEFYCGGIVNCEENLENVDAYADFLEDNPDAESIEVESRVYSYGEGESENPDDEELAKIANKGDEFLDSENVDEIESSSFIILTDNEEIGEDDGESFRMGGM